MVIENINGTELKFKNPGRLLLIVIGFVFWGVGFLDLLGHTSADADLFGLYSLPFFILILLYASTIVVWIALFFNSNLLSHVAEGVWSIQNSRLVYSIFVGLAIALWVIFEWDRWARLPGLQFAAFGLVALAFLIFLFAYWEEGASRQHWRRSIAYPLAALLGLEVILQAAAWFGVLPGRYTIGGDFYPYERIYYSGDELHDRFANRYGLYFPDVQLDDDKRRILVVGGSYVQALHTRPEQQFSLVLQDLLNQGKTDKASQTELVPIGMPGFGLSPFLYEDTMTEMPNILNMDEMIVVFHLGDDFQSAAPESTPIRYTLNDSSLEVHPDDARLRHDLTHYYLRGYMSLQLVETIRGNYLTPKVISSLLQGRDNPTTTGITNKNSVDFPRQVAFVTDRYDVNEPGHAGIKTTDVRLIPGGNNFMFAQDRNPDMREAVAIADGLLATAQEIAQDKGITLRLVTVPMFPEAFYDAYPSGPWQSQVGEYDVFLPEKALQEIAEKHGIPFLPMGQYMLETGLSAQEVEDLYLPGGAGSLTPEGHEYFAQAIYSCFYSAETIDLCTR